MRANKVRGCVNMEAEMITVTVYRNKNIQVFTNFLVCWVGRAALVRNSNKYLKYNKPYTWK